MVSDSTYPQNNYYSFHGGQNGENVATTVGAKKPFLHVDRGASKPES